MRKNNKDKKFGKLVVISLFVILVMMSTAQAVVKIDIAKYKNTLMVNKFQIVPETPPMHPLDDPVFTWEDDFETMEWIDPDPDMSYNFTIENDIVKMKDTYTVWSDPDWTRIKPITLTNNENDPLTDFAIKLDVEYDSDMQDDYDDIRFKHESTPNTWLNYWIETKDSNEAIVWVKVESIPEGESMLYLFYGNPDATSESDFYSVFTDWDEKWDLDYKISIHAYNEGTWDPDVSYGDYQDGRFLVAWEEGTYWPIIKQEIRATLFKPDGSVVKHDFRIYGQQPAFQFRNENPSIAYGGSKFFVAWQRWDKNHPKDATTMDIKGTLVHPNTGDTGSLINICSVPNCQADPNVVFDSVNDQFCVVWEDARGGMSNYCIYGRLYDTNGDPVGSEKQITSNSTNQCEPWVAFDPVNEQYMIVWEDGINAANGPFSLWAGLFDSNLDQIGSNIHIITGNDNTDYNFPCVEFCEETERFLITWNDGDISDEDLWGNVWGRILDTSGNTVVNNFIIKSGNYVRTDIVPYLGSSFFVSFNSKSPGHKWGLIWGKLVSSQGDVFPDDVKLSVAPSAQADEANMAAGDGEIFVVWEDERIDQYSEPDVYGNMWHLNVPGGDEVTYEFDTEKKLILEAQLTSEPLPEYEVKSWNEFGVDFDGTITFDILDSTGNTVLIHDASNGEDLSGIDASEHPKIRLQAHFTRDNPSYTPTLDYWSVTYYGVDDDPPHTVIDDIIGTVGNESWYLSNVKIILNATDGFHGSGVNHTYFKIDDGDVKEYDKNIGINLPEEATGDPNTLFGEWNVWYWSVDKAGNNETPQGPVNIKIDKVGPYCETHESSEAQDGGQVKGDFWFNVTATDEGSGIDYVMFDTGPLYNEPEYVYEDDPPDSDAYRWHCIGRHYKKQWRHIIAYAYDKAGNDPYKHDIYVYFANPLSFPYYGMSGATKTGYTQYNQGL